MATKQIREDRFGITRAAAAGPHTLTGYAATYNQITNIKSGGFWEILARGCFDSVMASKPDVRFLVNHEPSKLLARTKSGTLRLKADDKGLYFLAELPDTQLARETLLSVQRGDMDGCSFGFAVADGGDVWTTEKNAQGEAYVLRTITKIGELFDASVVTYPAYEKGTSVMARAIPREVQAEARSRGWSPDRIVGPKEMTLDELRAMARQQGEEIAKQDYAFNVEQWRTSKWYFKL